jgi:hypothetical protein
LNDLTDKHEIKNSNLVSIDFRGQFLKYRSVSAADSLCNEYSWCTAEAAAAAAMP